MSRGQQPLSDRRAFKRPADHGKATYPKAGARNVRAAGTGRISLCSHCPMCTLARQSERAAAPVTEGLPALLSFSCKIPPVTLKYFHAEIYLRFPALPQNGKERLPEHGAKLPLGPEAALR